jgi:hypothetical protein
MIPITKAERDALTKKYGIQYGEGGISRTFTHSSHYYLCESKKNKDKLKEYYKELGLNPQEVDKRCSRKG